MDSQLIAQKSPKTTTYLAWIIVVLAIFSCSSRADYNLLIGFLILFLRSQYANDKYKMFTKVVLHAIILSLLFDFIWIWQYSSYWQHGEETSDLWKSLSVVHNLAYYFGIIESLLKLPIILFLYKKFNNLGGINKELFSFNYSTPK